MEPSADSTPEMLAIYWWDSETEVSEPWSSVEEVTVWAQQKMSPVISCGIVVHRDSESITLAVSHDGHYCSPPTRIPMLCIARIAEVDLRWEGA